MAISEMPRDEPANPNNPQDLEEYARFRPIRREIVLKDASTTVIKARERQVSGQEPLIHELVDYPSIPLSSDF